MGAHLARRYLWDAEVEPDPLRIPTFEPQYGFPEREERGKQEDEEGHLELGSASSLSREYFPL